MSKSVQNDHAALRGYLSTLFSRGRETLLVEVRFRTSRGMRRSFEPAPHIDQLVSEISSLAARSDVYVGVLPRWRPGGGRADVVATPSVLWVDCDGLEPAAALEAFRPQPAMVVASGTEGHRHAYWPLRRGVTLARIKQSNRRLAWALGADLASSDGARILRPPGTLRTCRARIPSESP